MSTTFAQLGIPTAIVAALDRGAITKPFPVQELTIPDILSGEDVSVEAPTGSGKTLAFGLPLLARVRQAAPNRPRALILTPTRELAEQIKQHLAPLSGAVDRRISAVYGGVGYGPQRKALRRGVDVMVATPGRLEDLIEQGWVDLRQVDIVVVDEADRMADMGFLPPVRRILDRTSPDRQTLLFSATLDGDVGVLSAAYQRNPIRHVSKAVEVEKGTVRHHFWQVEHHQRVQHTADVVDATGRSIVFTRTRHGADRLAKQLGRLGIDAVAIHGGRSQNQRNRSLDAFTSGRAQALIATDVAARGIHVDAVSTVIHFDPPADAKDFLHRSGRTARAGAQGAVVTLVTKKDHQAVRRIQRHLGLNSTIDKPRLEDLHRPDNGKPGRSVKLAAEQTGRRRPAPTPTRAKTGVPSIYVGNLPWSTTADEIRTLFAPYGAVQKASVVSNRRTGRSKGFGFVDMPAPAARLAIEALHGSSLAGRDLTVRFARPR